MHRILLIDDDERLAPLLAEYLRRGTALGLVPRLVVPGAIAVVHTGLMGPHFAAAGGGYATNTDVRRLFASGPVLAAGCGHDLAFHLLIGAPLADRLDRDGVTRWLQAPVLLATVMFRPAGWLLGTATEAAARMRTRRSAGDATRLEVREA